MLGTHSAELQRLGRQHTFWRRNAAAACSALAWPWRSAWISAAGRFCSWNSLKWWAPAARCWGWISPSISSTSQQLAHQHNLSQLRGIVADLADRKRYRMPATGMGLVPLAVDVLPKLEPLLNGLSSALRPGGRLLLQNTSAGTAFRCAPAAPPWPSSLPPASSTGASKVVIPMWPAGCRSC